MKGIIFDLDGVIVHTDNFHYLAWKSIADQLGIHFDQQINNRLRGVSRMQSLDIILEQSSVEFSPQQKVELAERKNNIYKQLLQDLTPSDVSPKVVSTLRQLKQHYQLAIGSSSKNAKSILNYVGLIDMFDAISDGTNIVNTKPDPEVFLKAAQYLCLPPHQCVVVEDAVAGITAGKNANMITIAVGDASINKAGDYNIDSFEQILDIMSKL